MTIALTVKVHDGVVIASDSATTLPGKDQNGQPFIRTIYNHQNKIFNLIKGLPVGAITYGVGNVGHASISTLSKDIRRLFATGSEEAYAIDRAKYTIEEIAEKVRCYFEERMLAAYPDGNRPEGTLGYWITGYSPGAELSETWDISFVGGVCEKAVLKRPVDECGMDWSGEPEAIARLILGRSNHLPQLLKNIGMDEKNIDPAMAHITQSLMAQVLHNPMPIQDAIDLAEFLVDLTIRFSKFTPGGATVGGPIEIAAITKHEGFKWVRRKHYFDKTLNSGADDERAISD